jgi:hypothetical protein
MYSVQARLGIHTESIEGALWQWACAMRSSIPGVVVSFNAEKQTCVVRPAIQEIVMLPPPGTTQTPSSSSPQAVPTTVSIDPIQDVPICMMRVPGWSVTLPIVEGTECLLIFSDTCIDGWWQNGGVNPPYDRRRHDLSDAIALFGPWSQPKVLENYSTSSMQIRSDDQSVMIDLSSVGVTITAPSVKVISSGGSASPVMTQEFFSWFTTNIEPFLVAKGYTGPVPPTSSITTVLEAE